jgi:UDP-N-acetylmuramate dehydrogenase
MQAVRKPNGPDFARVEKALRRACPRGLRIDEPMTKHTSIAAGGPVRFFAVPESASEIIALVRAAARLEITFMGIGRGSNLLVRSGGFDGLMIKVSNNVGELRLYKKTAYAEAGLSLTRLGNVLTRSGRPGFEFAIGIPGSVGGAVRMNAGAFGSEISQVLKSVKVIDGNGRIAVLQPEQLAFRYRHSELPPDSTVLSAIFNCPPGPMDPSQMERTLVRKDTQPLSQRSFGSTFKNPPEDFAARLIEASGLKGHRRGGVMISDKHANFVVNVDEGTLANDIEDLIEFVIETVKEKHGVKLEPEVIIVGNR